MWNEEKKTLEDQSDEDLFETQNVESGEQETPTNVRRVNRRATREHIGKFVIRHLPKIVVGAFALLVLIGIVVLIKTAL